MLFCVYRKYPPLVSVDQRQSYKDDFNAEYDEYRLLHARVESITRHFTQLDAQCRKLAPGTKEYQVIEAVSLDILYCMIFNICVDFAILIRYCTFCRQLLHNTV